MSVLPSKPKPVTVPDFLAARSRGVRLTVLTAYDYALPGCSTRPASMRFSSATRSAWSCRGTRMPCRSRWKR